MACSTTFGTEGGVGDAAWLSVLPGTKDPAERQFIFSGADTEHCTECNNQ